MPLEAQPSGMYQWQPIERKARLTLGQRPAPAAKRNMGLPFFHRMQMTRALVAEPARRGWAKEIP